MYSKSKTFLKYFKSETKSLSKSSKLNFEVLTESFFNLILYFQLPIERKKVADFSEQSSRRVLLVVGAY